MLEHKSIDTIMSEINAYKKGQRAELPTPLRILSIDGGAFASLNLYVLEKLEEAQPGTLEKTAMFCGTSDGALVSLSLSFHMQHGDDGLTAIRKTIEFEKKCARLFAPGWLGWLRFVLGLGPLSGDAFIAFLKSEFGHTTLGDLVHRPVSMVALNPVQQTVASFTRVGPLKINKDFPLWAAGAAVCALPFFLPIVRVPAADQDQWQDRSEGDWMLDGGLANNDPSMAGISDALLSLSENDQERTDYFLTPHQYIPYLRVLSVGGKAPSWDVAAWEKGTQARWLQPIGWGWPRLLWTVGIERLLNLVVGGPSISNLRALKQVIGVHRFFRFEPAIDVTRALLAIMFPGHASQNVARSVRSMDSVYKKFREMAEQIWKADQALRLNEPSDNITKNSLYDWVECYWKDDWSQVQRDYL